MLCVGVSSLTLLSPQEGHEATLELSPSVVDCTNPAAAPALETDQFRRSLKKRLTKSVAWLSEPGKTSANNQSNARVRDPGYDARTRDPGNDARLGEPGYVLSGDLGLNDGS